MQVLNFKINYIIQLQIPYKLQFPQLIIWLYSDDIIYRNEILK